MTLPDGITPHDPHDTPANAEDYQDASRIARALSETQVRLLYAAAEAAEESPLKSIVVHPADVPAALGLERRELLHTHRPTEGSFWNRRSVKGSVRTAWLLDKGRAVVQHLPPMPARQRLDVDLDQRGMVVIKLDGLAVARGRMHGSVLVVTDGASALTHEQWDAVAVALESRGA